MKSLFIMMIFLSLMAQAQEQNGIQFEKDLSWQQVLKKAKADDKYIFVDCFATWCGPCKLMDKSVYPNEDVGTFFNDKFISVKVQMDTSKLDNDDTRKWYADAHQLQQQYRVMAFPSYLFFSPQGKIIHRGLGALRDTDFIKLGENALDPGKQYYTLLEGYRQGKKNYQGMGYLARKAKKIGDTTIANIIAYDYIDQYLSQLTDEELCTKENFEFVSDFPPLINSKENIFRLFYSQPDRVDKVMYTGYSDKFVRYVINKEEITGRLWQGKTPITNTPDWNKLNSFIKKKYNRNYAKSLVLSAQLSFYRRIENWEEYAKYRNIKIRQYPPKPGGGLAGDPWGLNSDAWDVFLHCKNENVLKKALAWSELSIILEQANPDVQVQYLDTKANLLYKLGRVEEAIEWENKAIELDTSIAKKKGQERGMLSEHDYYPNLAKMGKGKPTWEN
jgi:thioredoxin-related protein